MMKLVGTAALLVIATALAADTRDDAKQAADRLEGTWKVVSMERDGKKVSREEAEKMRVEFKGQRYAFRGGDEDYDGTFRADASQKPKHIDTVVKQGGKTINARGIYELDGDTLKICWSDGDERPTAFATKPDSGLRMLVLRREKP
jgi:uncharacterized protein (TIGR03067 family)